MADSASASHTLSDSALNVVTLPSVDVSTTDRTLQTECAGRAANGKSRARAVARNGVKPVVTLTLITGRCPSGGGTPYHNHHCCLNDGGSTEPMVRVVRP